MSKSAWKNRREDGKSVRRHHKGRINGPFVALLKDTLKTPAWKATSLGARSLFVVLKSRYNHNLMNAVHVSTRIAAQELAVRRETVRPWFGELEHFGFIVMISPAHHGVSGHGKSPHWRLTDVPYIHRKEPTRDFLLWDGTPFTRPGKPNRLHALKNRSRGSDAGASAAQTRVPVSDKKLHGNGTRGSHAGAISEHGTGSHAGAISKLTTCHSGAGHAAQGQEEKEPR
jgi:hypothetical protein